MTDTTAHRLRIDSHGRLQGDAWVTHNSPFPCVNGQPGLTPPMSGAVLHTNVGSLPGTVTVFNRAGFEASAHFEVGGHWSGSEKNGQAHIVQFGPTDGWEAWHVENGNSDWYGIEVEDGGDPANPMTDAQVTAVAQIVEALASNHPWGFPLQVTDHPSGKGLGAHYMGGATWGQHSCPDPAPGGQGPRSHQRHEIIRRARVIREHGQYPAPAPPPTFRPWTADGKTSLAELAAANGTQESTILRVTIEQGGAFAPDVAHWLNGVFSGPILATAPIPAGIVLYVPVPAR